MRRCAGDLTLAGVDRDHIFEKLRERERRLSVAGRAVERQLFVRRDRGDIFEKRSRILRPELRVAGCLLRKVIFESHGLL